MEQSIKTIKIIEPIHTDLNKKMKLLETLEITIKNIKKEITKHIVHDSI